MEHGEEKKSRFLRGVKIALGLFLLPLGIVGLFVPVLQGVLLLLLGFALLASEVPQVARLRDRIRERYPEAWNRAEELGHRAKGWFRAKVLGRRAED